MNIHYSPGFHESRRSSPITVVDGQKPPQDERQKLDQSVFHSLDNEYEPPFQEFQTFSIQQPPTPHRGRDLTSYGQLPDTPTRINSTRSGRSSHELSATPGRTQNSSGSPGHDFEVVTADNAQALLPPRACVFVAK